MLHCQILIPCKPLAKGKTRLSQFLSARERYDLCTALLDRTLNVAQELTPADRIWLITEDAAAAARAAAMGIPVITDQAHTLNGALTNARDYIIRNGSDCGQGLLILPIDLPFADDAAIVTAANGGDVSIAGDHDGIGTNLLLLKRKAARDFAFSFGANSFARHCEIARRAAYSVTIVESPALAFDIDEPRHYVRTSHLANPQAVETA
jgi:2-phospho-L-lactate guanylyltransferase